MSNPYSDFSVLAAITRLEPELPTLFGESWTEIQTQVEADLEALRHSSNDKEQEELAERLIDTMNQYSQSQKRLNAELNLQELNRQELYRDLQPLASHLGIDDNILKSSLAAVSYTLRWSLDAEDIPLVENLATRAITTKSGGVGGMKSIKFRNLNLDFGEMSMIVGGAFLAAHDAIKEPNGFVIAAGVLLTIGALNKAATIQIDEKDASVFWGFIQTRGRDNTATEAAIINSTNRERAKYRRTALTDADILQSMINLELIKSVIRVDGQPGLWKIIEQFKIKT